MKKSTTFDFVDLSKNDMALDEMIAGQKNALRQFGAPEDVLTSEDLAAPAGTYAIIARNTDGKAVGGVRIHSRFGDRSLPIESGASPLSQSIRAQIAEEPNVCELRGLWSDIQLSKALLSRQMVSLALAACYELNFESVIAIAHLRSYKFVVAPLGFEIDPRVAPMPYPDERFESVVVWHRDRVKVTEKAPQLKVSSV